VGYVKRLPFKFDRTSEKYNVPFFSSRIRERARAEIFEGVDDALFCLLFIHDTPSPTQSLDAGDLIEVGIIAEQRQSVLAHQGGDL